MINKYDKIYDHYLVKCGYFIYNGVDTETGGVGYLYNGNGFDGIFNDGDEISVFEILKSDENIDKLKMIMSDNKNEIIKISDISNEIKISVTTKEDFLKHIEDYSEEVLLNYYEFDSNQFLYHWNII